MTMADTHTLRSPCSCGSTEGTIRESGGQDVVRCAKCATYQYNAPRVETGRKIRSLATREGVTVIRF